MFDRGQPEGVAGMRTESKPRLVICEYLVIIRCASFPTHLENSRWRRLLIVQRKRVRTVPLSFADDLRLPRREIL